MSISADLIVVMVKAPRAGQVKTRLCPPLTGDEAASLAACFAEDVVTKARTVTGSLWIAVTPANGRQALETILPSGLRWTLQRGTDLGDRMQAVIEEASAQGFGPIVLIGTDSPTLPPALLQMATNALHAGRADVVLGPTEDGGYYLVGVRAPIPGLFDNVAWSTARAREDTERNVAAHGHRLLRLPSWYDVDTPEDLRRLREELRNAPLAREYAPKTHRWFSRHEDLDNRSYAE